MDDFREAGIRLVALSADDAPEARSMKESEELDFPVLYGLDVTEMRERLGLYIHRNERTHLQPAQFILDPDGTVRLACYSSGAVGRLDAGKALSLIRHMQDG